MQGGNPDALNAYLLGGSLPTYAAEHLAASQNPREFHSPSNSERPIQLVIGNEQIEAVWIDTQESINRQGRAP